MSKRVLVDTNIFLDYFLNRKSGYLPLGEFAAQFIVRTLHCEFELLLCEEVLGELSRLLNIPESELLVEKFSLLKSRGKIEIIVPSGGMKKEADELKGAKSIPFVDALLAVVAKELSVPVITRDKHFFEVLTFVEARRPEEL
jgi:predicted nucleic acid-binding protein